MTRPCPPGSSAPAGSSSPARAGAPTCTPPETEARDWYFPEGCLSRWLAAQGQPATVYAFPKVGVRPLRAAYAELAEHLGLDAVVLVDGGTDILMRGDEAGLGTPADDMTSLAAAHALDVPVKVVAAAGVPALEAREVGQRVDLGRE
ncbi:DUF1152 domain-containing protein [Nonomuraea gerenzanensis]|uniref:Uncharacterized protein n=1 Tax=Nonomuraea gerenzanensis TaxID=93944 RepID=A0A1M4E1R0_9ACTN|nr:DUF1152 domain-containing protein [Nonomuraea gerenzanensis]UBU15034.1 DUF1152 domain-containing protein [Nonomuraea gerenzanensis]SBO92777.1 FIG01133369: hypothetical protein [Nonomuraea gerenzanensis]